MEEKLEQAYLYDFYGELLNEHQRRIYEDFVFNDLSLGEIAKDEGISRQGVHDMVRRCNRTLERLRGEVASGSEVPFREAESIKDPYSGKAVS